MIGSCSGKGVGNSDTCNRSGASVCYKQKNDRRCDLSMLMLLTGEMKQRIGCQWGAWVLW